MLVVSIILAFLAPFFWRVFWKSFDEVGDGYLKLLNALPETVQAILSGLIWAGAMTFGLYHFAELPIEAASGIAIAVTAVLLRLPMATFDARIVGRLIGWVYGSVVSLKARMIR